jgi:hypothetical protein
VIISAEGETQARKDISIAHCKKVKLFPARESLVSDIPTGDGKIADLSLQWLHFSLWSAVD